MRSFVLPLLAFVLGTITAVDAACSGSNARVTPPSGAIVVDPTGSYQNSVKTVSAGVAKLSSSTTSQQTIFILPGTYREQVLISALNGPLVVQGYTCDTTSYAQNQVTITHTMALKDNPSGGDEMTSTLRLKGKNVKLYNLNIANPEGKIEANGQALALYNDGSNYGFYACSITGYQDTVCANNGVQIFARSHISGAVDFVFGQHAQAWFESCDIESIGTGYLTASGRGAASDPSWYVFNHARVYGSGGAGSTYLGRPWGTYARVVWQNSQLGDVVNAKGWSIWTSTSSTANVYFKEFNNTGAGAGTSQRVSFSGQLKSAVAITDILGEDYKSQWWVDTSFL